MSEVPTQLILDQPLGPSPLRSPLPFYHPAMPDNGTGSSLDRENKSARCVEPPSAWELMLAAKRKRRMYQRTMSGFRIGGNLRLITLTTSEAAWEKKLDIQRAFRSFIQRLRRRSWCSGYVKVVEYTKRGYPHIHLVLRGPYIPHWWLSQTWSQLHLSPVVDVRTVQDHRGMGSYLGKYLGKDLRARYSWSWDWVWKGFVADWKALLADGFGRGESMGLILEVWNGILDRYRIARVLDA